MTFSVLFSSVGRRVELVRAFRRAFSSLGIEGRIIAIDNDRLAPALRCADKALIVPRLSSPEYLPALIELCRTEHVNIIFPLIDPDIPVLSKHRATIEQTGAKVAVVGLESARIAGDKWRTHSFFKSLGLKTPRSWLPQDSAARDTEFPLFVKPRGGSASKKCFRVDSSDELKFFSHYVPNAIIQEFLPGPEITSDIACTLDSEVLSVVSRRRIEVRGGEVTKGVTVKDPSIIDACVRIAHALPAVGPITVQCILKEGIPHYTEINARFGGGLPLGIAAGVDSPRWLIASVAGIPQALPPLGDYTEGLFCSRFDDSFFFSESTVEDLQHSKNLERSESLESLQSDRVRS